MRRPAINNHKILLALTLAATMAGIAIFFATNISTPPPRAACPPIDEIQFAPPSLNKIIDESAVIVEGKLERVDQFGAKVKVAKVTKGTSVRSSESLGLCPTAFDLTKTEFGDDVIVFLKGKGQGLWAGTWQGYSTTNLKDGQV